jgi:ABC-type proline/glycine betaine transport system permease subunit
LLLTITATLIAWVIALPLGVWSAERYGRLPDRLLSWATAGLLVIPDLALALGLLVLAVRTGWFPTGGMTSLDFESLSFGDKIRDLVLHMTLPVAALVFSALPLLLRHVRAAVAEVLGAPFVLAAKGHGIPKRTLLYRYALRAAANPLISLFGFSVGALLSGSLLVEVVMSWPGLGPLLLESIHRVIFTSSSAAYCLHSFPCWREFFADILLTGLIPNPNRNRRQMRSRPAFVKWLVILVVLRNHRLCWFFAVHPLGKIANPYLPPMPVHRWSKGAFICGRSRMLKLQEGRLTSMNKTLYPVSIRVFLVDRLPSVWVPASADSSLRF